MFGCKIYSVIIIIIIIILLLLLLLKWLWMIFQLHAKQLFQFISIHQFARTLCFQRNSVELLIYRSLKMQAWLQLDCISECWLIKTCLGLKYPATTFFRGFWDGQSLWDASSWFAYLGLSPQQRNLRNLLKYSSMARRSRECLQVPRHWHVMHWVESCQYYTLWEICPLQTTIFRHKCNNKNQKVHTWPGPFLFLLPG